VHSINLDGWRPRLPLNSVPLPLLKRSVENGDMVEHEEDITDQDHGNHVPGKEEVLMETEDENPDSRHHELVRKKGENSPAQKIVHDRVQLLAAHRDIPVGITGIEERHDDNQKEDEKKAGTV